MSQQRLKVVAQSNPTKTMPWLYWLYLRYCGTTIHPNLASVWSMQIPRCKKSLSREIWSFIAKTAHPHQSLLERDRTLEKLTFHDISQRMKCKEKDLDPVDEFRLLERRAPQDTWTLDFSCLEGTLQANKTSQNEHKDSKMDRKRFENSPARRSSPAAPSRHWVALQRSSSRHLATRCEVCESLEYKMLPNCRVPESHWKALQRRNRIRQEYDTYISWVAVSTSPKNFKAGMRKFAFFLPDIARCHICYCPTMATTCQQDFSFNQW